MNKWDNHDRAYEWMLDHGFRLANDGIMETTEERFSHLAHTSNSVSNPNIRTLIIHGDYGIELIFEHKHFRVTQ